MGEAVASEGFDLTGFAGGESRVKVVMQMDGFGDNSATPKFGPWLLFRVAMNVEFVVKLAGNC